MENILPCHSRDLPKLADKTILSLPITISIVMPAQKISFWQSSTAFWFFCGLVIPTFSIWLALLMADAFYHSVELTKNGNVMFYTFIAMFLFLLGLSYENRNKNFPNPNLFLAKKIKWKTMPIMIIEPQKIVLTDYFKVEKEDLIFDEIKKFYSQGKRKGIPYDGFLVEFKDEKLNKGDLKLNPYIIPNNYLVINSHRIFLRELLNLMNTTHKNRMNEIKFLSMDNDENLMDIGW